MFLVLIADNTAESTTRGRTLPSRNGTRHLQGAACVSWQARSTAAGQTISAQTSKIFTTNPTA